LVPGLRKGVSEPIAEWPEGCCALLVPDPFSEHHSSFHD